MYAFARLVLLFNDANRAVQAGSGTRLEARNGGMDRNDFAYFNLFHHILIGDWWRAYIRVRGPSFLRVTVG